MTNYADPTATRPVVIGPCHCPGTPHGEDTADVVVLFGYGEKGLIRQASRLGGVEAGYQKVILLGVRRWNLVLPDGSERPIDATQVARLDEPTVLRLLELLDLAFVDDPLPNGSGARSQHGRRASASRTPTTKGQPTSTST